MNQYKSLSDEELIGKLRQGDEGIMDYILDKYKPLVVNKSKTLYLYGGDIQDLTQEGMIGLFKAVVAYDAAKGATFRTFAEVCIDNQLKKAITSSQRDKNIPLNTYVSFSEERRNDDGSSYTVMDLMSDGGESSPEHLLLDLENVKQIKRAVKEKLSAYENQVFELQMQGLDYMEIARKLGKNPKSIDNCLQRIKRKLEYLI